MIVLYALTGGYTELHGALDFLREIRDDLQYKRLLPAVFKPGPKRNTTTFKPGDQGMTGERLLLEAEKRLRVHEDRNAAAALIVWDDLDCRPLDTGRYALAVEKSTQRMSTTYQGLTVVFLHADPEIESWFCLQCSRIFAQDVVLCKALKAYRSRYFRDHKAYDPVKDTCVRKFSTGFADTLCSHGKQYSKRHDGPIFLGQLEPLKLMEQDVGVKQAVLAVHQLSSQTQ